jgi:hypothetical protein
MTAAHPPVPTLSEQRVAAELRTADDKLMATQIRGRPKADGFAVSNLLYSAAISERLHRVCANKPWTR